MYDYFRFDRVGLMNRGLRTVLLVLALACASGCHGSCRRAPGPAFIERRPVELTDFTRHANLDPEDAEPLTARKRFHPAIGRLRGTGSLSIGTATRGFLVGGRELPLVGPNYRVMAEQAGRATNFGTDELVEAIVRASVDVAVKYPGSMLPVGNLSRGGGGEVRWSVSHKTGRDIDIGFYLRTPEGTPVFQESMTRIGTDGSTILGDGTMAMLDVPRTWAMVKSLLNSRKVSVQWIFMADHIKKRLIGHARARREPASLIGRADDAIAQPRGLIHDDHIHIRIYCSDDDLLEGCVDMGTNRPWYSPPGPKLKRRSAELAKLAKSPDPLVRRDAVLVLGHLGDPARLGLVASRLFDDDVDVRRAAAGGLAWLGYGGQERRVAEAIMDISTPDDLADGLLRMVELSRIPASRKKVFGLLAASARELNVDNGVFVTVSVVGARAAAGLERDR